MIRLKQGQGAESFCNGSDLNVSAQAVCPDVHRHLTWQPIAVAFNIPGKSSGSRLDVARLFLFEKTDKAPIPSSRNRNPSILNGSICEGTSSTPAVTTL